MWFYQTDKQLGCCTSDLFGSLDVEGERVNRAKPDVLSEPWKEEVFKCLVSTRLFGEGCW